MVDSLSMYTTIGVVRKVYYFMLYDIYLAYV